MKVVCDSTALIALAKISRLPLLRHLFSSVLIPDAVYVGSSE
jgi:predicted nucleic acid-binding protein